MVEPQMLLQMGDRLSKINQCLLYGFVFCLPLTVFFPILAPVAAGIFPMYVTPGIYLSDILMGSLFLSVIVLKAIKRDQPVSIPRLDAVLVILLVAASFLSIPGALSQSLAFYSSLRWVIFLLAGYLLLASMHTSVQLERIFILTLLPQLAIGILQMLNFGPLGLPLELALPASNTRSAILYIPGLNLYRPYGLTFHPNVFGGLMAVGFLLSLRLPPDRKYLILKIIMLLGGLISFSRSAWLAIFIVCLPLIYWQFKRRKPRIKKSHLVLILPLLLIVGLLLPFIVSRLNISTSFSENTSLIARGQMIQLALSAIQQNPFTGMGSGNFPIYMSQFNTLDPAHYVHNVPLLFASETGVISGLAWIILWLLPVVRFFRKPDPDAHFYPLVAAWTALGIIGLWDSYPVTLENTRLLMLFLLILITKERQNAISNS
jgi:O-antigen ligase